MAACQEVTWEAVKQFRELEQCVSEGHLVAPSVVAPAVAEAAEDVRALEPHVVCEELLKAVAWHTDLKDESVQLVVAEALAPAEREALLLKHKNRDTRDKRVTRQSGKGSGASPFSQITHGSRSCVRQVPPRKRLAGWTTHSI